MPGSHRDERLQDHWDEPLDRLVAVRNWCRDASRAPADEHYPAAAESGARWLKPDGHRCLAGAGSDDRTSMSGVPAEGQMGVKAPPQRQRDVVWPERSVLRPGAAADAQRRRTRFGGTPERTSAQVPLMMMKKKKKKTTEPAGGCWR